MNAIKLKSIQNSMVSAKNNLARSVSIFKAYSTFSYLKQRFILAICKHRIIFCHWFVAKTSKYTEHLLLVLIITLEVTVLKVIRIFLHQPAAVDNVINLVILSIIVAHITCQTTVLVYFDKPKLSNCKTREKLTDKYSYLPSFAYHVQSSSLCRTAQTPTYFLDITADHCFSFPIPHSPFPIPHSSF